MTKSKPNRDKENKLTLCEGCNCMTKTVKGKCGKCGENKPSKKYCQCEAGGGTGMLCSICHKWQTFENKPSKKTEWEDILDIGIAYSAGELNRNEAEREIVKKINYVLHQRDNEIREKIQGMKLTDLPDVVRVKSKDMPEGDLVEGFTYNQILDDLLTYLSNRNNE